jgi:beta-glucanase (GH16 family)
MLQTPRVSAQTSWKLAWSDEFDGPLGSAPDPAKWKFQAGPGAAIAGNDEAEFYCAPGMGPAPCNPKQPNAYLDGKGHLVLVAIRINQTVTVGAKKFVSPIYTSARMTTVPTFRYGRIEASLRVPAAGKGVWPAFWAMGQQTPSTVWPATGEIDILEQWNPVAGDPNRIDPLTIRGSVHGPSAPGSHEGYLGQTSEFVFRSAPSNGLHQFAIEWSPGEVDFFVDGTLYSRQSVGTLLGKEVWEQDRGPFSLLLNLAMGGDFFGYPDASTAATPTMVVDYVRVYQTDPHALPANWGNYDAGGPAEPGSSQFHNGVWTVAGGGFGIAGRFDQFQFAYRSMAADGEVTAHVLDQTSKMPQAKAGVMLRQDRGAASPYAMAFLSPDGSVHFRFRRSVGDVPEEVLYKGVASWLKLGRLGDVFTAYISTEGKNWSPVGNTKLPLNHDLLAGLIATSRDNGKPNVARFDYVNVTPTDAAYDGLATDLPGVVQAEHFDTGGPGYSYSADFGEAGPKVEAIPDTLGADQSASGFYLAALAPNRYLNYSVNVVKDGDYIIAVRTASDGPGGSLHFNLDQKPLSKPFTLPATGGVNQWRDIKLPSVHLAAGQHTLALVSDSAGASGKLANIDFFAVRAQ